jgi:hypothetical protein
MDITAGNLSIEAIHAFIEDEEKRKAEDQRKHAEAAKTERQRLHEAFLKEEVPRDAMDHVALMVHKAVEMGENEALVFQFPSDWLPDQGRAISSHAADWHEHLVGLAQRAYGYFERELKPRGFQLRAEILDWPGGMPGDVGIFLQWKRLEKR